MFEKIKLLMSEMEKFFDSVSIANDDALQKANRAVIFIDRMRPEYLTSNRRRWDCEIAIMYSVSGDPETAYELADEKFNQVDLALENVFSSHELGDLQYSYQHNVKRLFVFVRATFQWEDTIS